MKKSKKAKKAKNKKQKIILVEIARSFSYKVNAGNYETRDFFCSQKAEVPLEDAEKTSEALYQFCKKEVIKSVNEFQRKIDFSNLAENQSVDYFREKNKLTPEEEAKKREADECMAHDAKKENKVGYDKGTKSFSIVN